MSHSIIFNRKKWPYIRVAGGDRLDFLHRITSQAFLKRKEGDTFSGAFLNANGTVISLFLAHIRSDDILLFLETQSIDKTLQTIEKFHFSEDLAYGPMTDLHFIELRGETISREEIETRFHPQLAVQAFDWGIPGLLLGFDSRKIDAVLKDLRKSSSEKTETEMHDLEASFEYPCDQVDIGEQNIILEAKLEPFVNRNKGCYPGQEVIERIFTYGNVAKKIVKLDLPKDFDRKKQTEFESPDLWFEDKKVGIVTSLHQNAEGKWFVLASVQRVALQKAKEFVLKDNELEVTLSHPADA